MTGRELRIALVGHSFMGRVHSHAWQSAARVFDLPLRPVPAVLVGRNPTATAAAADKLGWASWSTDLAEVLNRPDVDVVDICTPGDSHAQIAVAALRAGKHVLCEKPLANSVDQAREMTAAAETAAVQGVQSMVGFTYRRVPASVLAARWVAEGRLGTIRHIRARYLQDWLVDPEFPLTWRLNRDLAGSGALGDLGAHIIDLVQFITGHRIAEISSRTQTFVTERPVATAAEGLSAVAGARRGAVTVDDAFVAIGGTDRGALVTLEASRFATGHKNAMGWEINGSAGSLIFEFESMNELLYYDARQPGDEAGFRRILVTEPDHPYVGAWWPPGHVLGYEHAFTHQVVDLVRSIHAGVCPQPSFADGLAVQEVLDALQSSADQGGARTTV